MKTQFNPRLDLCAAILGVNFLDAVVKSFSKREMKNQLKHALTDSTIVLSRLLEEDILWSTFVANRISKNQQHADITWRHASSAKNTAHAAFRGIIPQALRNHSLCCSGPQWLKSNKFPEERQFCETKEKLKRTDHVVTQQNPNQVVLIVTESKCTKIGFDLTNQNPLKNCFIATVMRALSRFRREELTFQFLKHLMKRPKICASTKKVQWS